MDTPGIDETPEDEGPQPDSIGDEQLIEGKQPATEDRLLPVEDAQSSVDEEIFSAGNIQKSPKGEKRSARLWNILTILVLVSVCCLVSISLLIYIAPQSVFNPFPPPTRRVMPTIPGLDPNKITPATPTSTNTPEPTATFTSPPTFTPAPTETPFRLFTFTPTLTFTPTSTPTEPPEGFPFVLHQGSPIAIANISHPELACEWMGVAGQVFDLSDSPIVGLLVQLGGNLSGSNIKGELISLTGVALNYGRAGYYEFTLADMPISSKQSIWLRILDQSGIPQSKKIFFDTFDTCDKNLIIINFKQVR